MRFKQLFESVEPGEYVYHASHMPDLGKGLSSVMRQGLVPSKDGYAGAGLYFAYDPEGGFYHVSKDEAIVFRVKWADLVKLYGVYPDKKNGIQRDDSEIIVPGPVPADLLEIEYFEDEWWPVDTAFSAEVREASYEGNIGIMELIKFNQKAASVEKALLKKLIDAGLTKQAWQLVQKVTGVKLQGAEFSEQELDEGWRDQLTNLAISTAIGLGATGGMLAKDAISNYGKDDAVKPVVAQTTQAKSTATANKTIPAQAVKAPEKTKVQTAKAPEKPKAKEFKVKPITKRSNELVLMDVAREAGITGKELAAFMAQMHHESEGFGDMVEDHPNVKRYLKTKSLGNKNLNDAKRFIGRGFIQLTGRWNYKWMEKELGIDLTSSWSAAHRAAEPQIAAKIAVVFWKQRVRPSVSNFKDVKAVTKPINPNLNGLEDRADRFNKYLQAALATSTDTSKEV